MGSPLLFVVGKPGEADEVAGWERPPKSEGFRFSLFSPSHNGFSSSFVGVGCVGLNDKFACVDATGAGLFNAGELEKKLGMPDPVATGGVGVGLFSAGEFAKKLGIPEAVVGNGAAALGLVDAAELAKKLGMLDPDE